MKKTKTFVFLALLGLTGLGSHVYAEGNLPVYEAPQLPVTEIPIDGGKYFVYNVNAQKFLTRTHSGGSVNEAWGTRACVEDYASDEQLPFEFTLGVNPSLSTSFSFYSTGYKRFSDNANSGVASGYMRFDSYVYTDHATVAYWELESTPNGYTIQAAGNEGYLAPSAAVHGSFIEYNVDNEYVNWVFITKEKALRYLAEKTLYPKLEQVKTLLEGVGEAPALKASFNAAVEKYNSLLTAPYEFHAQITLLDDAIEQFNYAGYEDVTAIYLTDVIFHEFWNWNGEVPQTIASLPAGTYRLRVQGFDAAPGQNSYLYVQTGGVQTPEPLGTRGVNFLDFVPTNVGVATEWFDKGGYPVSLTFIQSVAGEAKVGVYCFASNQRWSCYKNLQLIRIGEAPSFATEVQIDALNTLLTEATGLLANKMQGSIALTLENLKDTYEAANYTTSTEAALVVAANLALTDACNAARTSINAYVELKLAYDRLSTTWAFVKRNAPSAAAVSEGDAVLSTLSDYYEKGEFTGSAETMKIQIAAYHAAENAVRAAAVAQAVDSEKIKNATFDASAEGWNGATSGAVGANGYEFWNRTFAFYQELTGLSAAESYTLEVQGFYRPCNQHASVYETGKEELKVYLYATNGTTEWKLPLMSLYAESTATGSDANKPMSPAEGQTAFNKGLYKNILSSIVPSEAGTLTIGVRYEGSLTGSSWTYVDNFKLSRDSHFDAMGQATGAIVKGDLVASEAAVNYLSDDYAFNASADVAGAEVAYIRSFETPGVNQESNLGWQTLCLPFDVATVTHTHSDACGVHTPADGACELTPGNHFWIYRADEATGKFVAANRIEANQLYLLAMPNDEIYVNDLNIHGEVTFCGTGVKATAITPVTIAEDYSLTANYQPEVDANSYYILDYGSNGSVFKKGAEGVSAGSFWAYAISNTASGAGYFSLFDDLTSVRSDISTDYAQDLVFVTRSLAIEVASAQSIYLNIYQVDGTFLKRVLIPAGETVLPMERAGQYIVNNRIVLVNP